MKKILKFLIGLMLLPACWAASRTFYFLLIASSTDAVPWALPAGFLVSVAGFFILPQAFRTYVLGHELSHALAGLLMGAKIGKMKVSRQGGHVELSKSNFIISLAPYFIPFYTGLIVALWVGLGLVLDLSVYEPVWLLLVGMTWGFHLTFTLYMLTQEQPDVLQNGRLFSYVVIYLANLLVVGLWLIVIGEMTFEGSWNIFQHEIILVYGAIRGAAVDGWSVLVPLVQSAQAR